MHAVKRRLLRALFRIGWFRRISFTLSLRMNGNSVQVPVINGIGPAYFEPLEQWMPPLMRVLLELRPGLFIDVGMNVGQTLIKVKSVAPEQPVMGFEPNPDCVVLIKELIRLNGYTGVRVIPVALADRDHVAELQLYGSDPADDRASMVQGFRDQRVWRVDRIACMRFDTVERDLTIERIGVVKIDVEGAEAFVLKGMLERLRRDRPVIILEVLPAYHVQNTDRLQRQGSIEAMARDLDYRIFRLRYDKGPDLELEPIEGFGVHDKLHWSNHLLVPGELSDAVWQAIAARPAAPSLR